MRVWPISDISRQESSSTLSWMILTFLRLSGISPSMPRMPVRWKPVGMLPSRYCLRVMWNSPTMLVLSSSATSMAISTAWRLSRNGGVSSIS